VERADRVQPLQPAIVPVGAQLSGVLDLTWVRVSANAPWL